MASCDECGAQVAPADRKFHASWHEHLERMFDVAAGGTRPASSSLERNVADAFQQFKRALGVK